MLLTRQRNAIQDLVRIAQEKILDIDWSVLPHPPYSQDFAPSDIHFLNLYKITEFLSKSGKNVCGKILELKTSLILLERK